MSTFNREVVDRLNSYRRPMEAFISKLVEIKSENPPGNFYSECCDAVGDEIRRLNLKPITHELNGYCDSTPRAMQSFVGQGKPVVYFHGHYDVVPAFEQRQFVPEIKNGKMFGRGTADMKAGLALMLYAAKAASECADLQGRIGVTLVPDEETGGSMGSEILVRRGILGTDGIAMFTPEPTSGRIWNSARGAVSLRITTNGKAAHVGEHYRGTSAFDDMNTIVNRLVEFRSELATRETRFPISPAAARKSILLIGGTVQGGTNFNCVPEQCTFTVDRRFNPEESLEQEEKELLDVIGSVAPVQRPPTVEVFQRAASSASSSDSNPAQALARNAKEVLGVAPPFELCPGLLETRFYSQLGIPAFAFGPGLLSVAHGPNEFVDLDLVMKYAVIYALTAIELLAASS